MPEYIDMTPSWETAVRLHLSRLSSGNKCLVKSARAEIIRLARAYDAVQYTRTGVSNHSGFQCVPDRSAFEGVPE